MTYSQGEDDGCGPITDPSVKGFGLPRGGRVDSDSTPNQLAMDKAINARYGQPTDDMTAMGEAGKNPRFAGPGMPE